MNDGDDPGALIDALIGFLGTCDSAEELQRWLASHPAAMFDAAIERLSEMQSLEAYAASIALFEELLRGVRTDVDDAWHRYCDARAQMEQAGKQLEAQVDEIVALGQERRWGEVLEKVDSVIEQAKAVGAGLLIAVLEREAGIASLRLAEQDPQYLPDARERLERAIRLLPPPDAADAGQTALASDLLVNLGVVELSDPTSDRDDAIDAGIGLLGSAVEHVDRHSDPETWATAHTNLCRAWRQRQRGNREENLRTAASHAEQALAVRSAQQDADAWVVSQLNYADCLEALAAEGLANRADADAAYDAVIQSAHLLNERWPVALVHQSRADVLVHHAHELAENEDPHAEDVARQAQPHIERALDLSEGAPAVVRGRCLMQAGSFEAGWGSRKRAAELHRQAVALLYPGSPGDARDAGRALGELMAADGRWEEAADAYADAAAAAHLAFHAGVYEHSRAREVRANAELARFAAYALARAGRSREAVLVLEDLRATEFRRRAGAGSADLDALAQAEPELHGEYMRCLMALRRQPIGGVADETSREISAVLAVIRQRPGFEHFAALARMADIAPAVTDRPLIYVDPSPHGTVLLAVFNDAGDVDVSARFLDVPGDEIFYRLSLGRYEELQAGKPAGELPASYLGTAAGLISGRGVHQALDYVLDWLGGAVARPVSELLAELGATASTIVPCGPISAAPLHVARWQEDGERRCLLDDYDIVVAPSALVAAAAQDRARLAPAVSQRLVAVGDPTGDLSAAKAEVGHIRELFASSEVAFGPDATPAFLTDRAASASVLHLACHAGADLFDLAGSVIQLAGGELVSLAELGAVGEIQARLVCASACQTALPSMGGGDEAMSMATALLSTGAAAAVASLWSVPDLSTAVLMAKFYELMTRDGVEPMPALRQAQLWLREATAAELLSFFGPRPHLHVAYEEAAVKGALPDEFAGNGTARPWQAEVHWAAFTIHGA